MTLLWLVTLAALATAILAWRAARSTARRLDQLSQMYWALKYQHSELRGQLLRTQPETTARTPQPQDAAASSSPGTRPSEAFVPLSSLRR